MKKFSILPLLILILLFINIKNASADHVVGSETTWKYLGNDTFQVKLVIYRRCTDGAAGLSSPSLFIASDSCANLYNLGSGPPISYQVEDITPVCPSYQKPCPMSGGSGNSTATLPIGVERHTWIYKIFFGGNYANCCWYKIRLQLCCRSSNISTGPADQNFINDAWLNRCFNNSSPEFTNLPVLTRPAGHDAIYNIGVTDAEHDSISYRLLPLNAGTYNSPWSYKYPLTCFGGNNPNFNTNPPTGFSLDSTNGNIIFRPIQVQSSVFKVEVREWRKINGNYKTIGITSRDNQIVITQSGNNKIPKLISYSSHEVCTNQNYCFTLNTTDQDYADTTRIYSNLLTSIPNASITYIQDTIRRAYAIICWTPVDNNISSLPYFFNVIVEDNHCPVKGNNSISISIKVSATPKYTTSIKLIAGNSWKFEATPNGSFNNINYQWYLPTLVGQSLSNQVLVISQSTNYSFTLNGKYIIRSRMYNNSVCYTEQLDTIDVYCATPLQLISSNDTSVCVGSKVVLTTTAISTIAPYGYKWYANGILIDTQQTITLTPLVNTLYRVVVISGDTCRLIAIDTIKVTVDSTTLQLQPFSDIRICSGAVVSLTPTFLGTNAFRYYRWYFNSVLIDSVFIFNHRPSISGVYVFEVRSLSVCKETQRDTFLLNLDTNKISISSITDQEICRGDTVSLFPNILSGKLPLDYTWYENGTIISKSALLRIAPTTASTFVVKVLSQDSCNNIAFDTVNVSFFPNNLQVKLPNDTTVCANIPFTLNAQVSGGGSYTYNWCPQGKTCSTLPNPVYSFDSSTQIILEVSSNTNCFETKRDTMMVYVFPSKQLIINAANTSINKGQTTLLKASNGTNFSWIGNAIITNYGDSILVAPTTSTTYYLIGTNKNGCNDTASVRIDVNNVGLYDRNHRNENLKISPNPVWNELVVNYPAEIGLKYTVFNTLGQIVLEGNLDGESTNIAVQNLPEGLYFISIAHNVRKFVKK